MDEQERMLPIANVGRIMKQILPPSAKISKEAKQTMQECSTEFVSFVTGEASERCQRENRKTVNGDDICWALSSLGFDDYARAMMRYLQKYREQLDRDKTSMASPSSLPSDRGRDDRGRRSHQEVEERDQNVEGVASVSNSGKSLHTLEFRIINEKN